jgi:hypothetical protein
LRRRNLVSTRMSHRHRHGAEPSQVAPRTAEGLTCAAETATRSSPTTPAPQGRARCRWSIQSLPRQHERSECRSRQDMFRLRSKQQRRPRRRTEDGVFLLPTLARLSICRPGFDGEAVPDLDQASAGPSPFQAVLSAWLTAEVAHPRQRRNRRPKRRNQLPQLAPAWQHWRGFVGVFSRSLSRTHFWLTALVRARIQDSRAFARRGALRAG